jgi:hypothetical protein
MARAHSDSHRKFRTKYTLYAVGALLGGITLLVLSQVVSPAEKPSDTAVATAPAGPGSPTQPASPERGEASAKNLSGLLLLFGTACLLLCGICVGAVVWDVRRSRPAWKTQTKYPRRR